MSAEFHSGNKDLSDFYLSGEKKLPEALLAALKATDTGIICAQKLSAITQAGQKLIDYRQAGLRIVSRLYVYPSALCTNPVEEVVLLWATDGHHRFFDLETGDEFLG